MTASSAAGPEQSPVDGDPDTTDAGDAGEPAPGTRATDDRNTDPSAPADSIPEQTLLSRRETNRWRGIAGLTLLTGGIAVVTESAVLLLASAIGVGLLAFVQTARAHVPTLSIDRSFEPASPEPGEEVTVTATVRNEGEEVLADLRLVDLVPEALSVIDGSPRAAVTLRPGDERTLTYTVTARRGPHEFGGTLAIARGFAGAIETETRIEATDRISAAPRLEPLESVPLRSLTTPYAGRLTTDDGGEGIEFHATREYRPGDPMRRIDWNRHARSGELATLEFRTEQAPSVVLVADVRPAAYVSPGPGHRSAADRGVEAVGRLFVTLLEQGDQAGMATIGPECRWLPPRSGTEHRVRGRELLATDPLLSQAAAERVIYSRVHVRRLRQRLPDDAQVIVCTPLPDEGAEEIVRLLDAYGHRPTVVSPDPTVTDTAGRRLATTERSLRIARLRRSGIRVVDWPAGDSLDTAIARADERWSP